MSKQISWEEIFARKDIIEGDIRSVEDGCIYRGPISEITKDGDIVRFLTPWTATWDEDIHSWVLWNYEPVFCSFDKGDTLPSLELDGNIKAKIYLRNEFSPNDPYFVKENPDPNTLIVILNLAHPFIKSNLLDSESLRTYMLMCCYDAIAEWKCEFLTHVIEPSTVKQVKDNYMRMEVKI
jgi:hypothetical protein